MAHHEGTSALYYAIGHATGNNNNYLAPFIARDVREFLPRNTLTSATRCLTENGGCKRASVAKTMVKF